MALIHSSLYHFGVWEPVHSTLKESKNVALLISTVRSTVHTNPLRKRGFSKTLIKLEEAENLDYEVGFCS